MNNQQIKLIENKIQQISNLLINWTKQIATYQLQLTEIIKQVNNIKQQTKK